MASVGELFIFLGFKVDDAKLKDFDKGIKNLGQQLDLTKVAAGAAVFALDRIVESTLSGAVALYNFTQQTGESAQALQEWQVAAHTANPALGVDQVTQSFQNLDQALMSVKRGIGGDAQAFAQLRIPVRDVKNAADVFTYLRGKMDLYDRPTMVNLLSRIGINPGMINVLSLSKEKFDEFTKGLVRSQNMIDKLDVSAQKLAHLKTELNFFVDSAVGDFTPAIGHIIKAVEAFSKSLLYSYDLLRDIHNESPKAFKGLEIAAGILFAAWNPVFAVLTGIVLALGDIYAYTKGGKSITGDILGASKKEGEAVYSNVPGGKAIYDFLYDLGQNLNKISTGELHKNLANSSVSNNAGDINITNNIALGVDRLHPNSEKLFISSESIQKLGDTQREAMRQAQAKMNLNQTLTDQQPVGSGY